MNNRLRWCVAACVVGLSGGGAHAQDAAPPSAADTAKASAAELADRFEGLAYATGQSPRLLPPIWHEVSALARAAARLNPAEPRYPRLLTQALLQANDADGAAAALKSYLTLVPDDQVGQQELIDLYVRRMQTADASLAYLRGLLGKTALPAPVRSHAAVACADLLLARAQQEEALKVLDTATGVDPLNVQALRRKFELTKDQGAAHRVGLLLAMVRADPLDPDTATLLAGELADVGLVKESLQWYMDAGTLYNASGGPRMADFAKGAATELYLSGRAGDAASLLDAYVASIPDDADAWAIRLAVEKETGKDPAVYDRLAKQAVDAAAARFQAARASAGAAGAGAAPKPSPAAEFTLKSPATAPADVPDLSGDMPLLVKAGKPKLTDAYVAAAQDLAWLRLYFLRDAGAGTASLLEELSKLLPADDATLARLVGWQYLVQSKFPEARQKLSAVADRDAYAALGLVMLDDQAGDKDAADARARSAAASHPSGPAAAVLRSALHGRGVNVIPVGQADAVKAAVDTFPVEWMNVVARPQEFYVMSVEPVGGAVGYGQAMLARVTVENVSNYDLRLGGDGVLRPNLLFDAASRGLIEKSLPHVAVDQFWQRLVLASRQSASQVVRLDRGDLASMLNQTPNLPVDVQFTLTSNPLPRKDGVVPGPAGYRVLCGSLVERSGTPVNSADDRAKLYARLAGGTPAERFSAVEAVSAFEAALANAPRGGGGADATQGQALAKEMVDHLAQVTGDADPSVRAWATFRLAVASTNPQDRQAVVHQMAVSDDWFMRLLAVGAAQGLPDGGKVAAGAMSGDKDPAVKEYATAVSDYIAAAEKIAASQPTTQP